jgi:hypothetical protein
MAKRGRKTYQVDWSKVDYYLKVQCEGTEIADCFGISPMTLYRACEREKKVNFEVYKQQKASEGKNLLKVKQFQSANEGNTTMLIWLGKQYLGQTEKQTMDIKSQNDVFLDIMMRVEDENDN